MRNSQQWAGSVEMWVKNRVMSFLEKASFSSRSARNVGDIISQIDGEVRIYLIVDQFS